MVLIARTQTLQGNSLMNSANGTVAFWLQRKATVVNYFGLKRMNDSLLNENRDLRLRLARLTETDILNDSTVTLAHQTSDSLHKIRYAHYTYYKARVVNNSTTASSNFITINRGYKDGLKPNMAVVSGSGIVGRVTNVSAHFATVLSILNIRQSLSARLKDGTSSFIYWEMPSGPHEVLMKITQPEVPVRKGDTVFTTSYSTIFPADMPIGTVQKIFMIKKDNSRLLKIRPGTNFTNMQYVYVIGNDYIEERRRLEDTAHIQHAKLNQ